MDYFSNIQIFMILLPWVAQQVTAFINTRICIVNLFIVFVMNEAL